LILLILCSIVNIYSTTTTILPSFLYLQLTYNFPVLLPHGNSPAAPAVPPLLLGISAVCCVLWVTYNTFTSIYEFPVPYLSSFVPYLSIIIRLTYYVVWHLTTKLPFLQCRLQYQLTLGPSPGPATRHIARGRGERPNEGRVFVGCGVGRRE
jgi:hypothetical protein